MKRKHGVKSELVLYKIGNVWYSVSTYLGAWLLWSLNNGVRATYFGDFSSPKEAAQHALKMHETYVMTTAKTDARLLEIEGEIP